MVVSSLPFVHQSQEYNDNLLNVVSVSYWPIKLYES